MSVDLSAAEKAPGVKAVLAYVQPGAQVMYQGDPVAAVAADTEERALDAARLIRVRYEVLPHLANVEQAMAAGRAGRVPERQHAPGRRPKKPAISPPASPRRRTSSRRPTRRT